MSHESKLIAKQHKYVTLRNAKLLRVTVVLNKRYLTIHSNYVQSHSVL